LVVGDAGRFGHFIEELVDEDVEAVAAGVDALAFRDGLRSASISLLGSGEQWEEGKGEKRGAQRREETEIFHI
jgi:hypothetical protein